MKLNKVPAELEDELDCYFMNWEAFPEDYIRFEFRLFRPRLNRQLKKSAKLSDVLDTQFQRDTINGFIKRLGVHRPILSRTNFRAQVDNIFKRKPTRLKAHRLANYVRQGRKPTNPKQYAYIASKLAKHHVHIVTSTFADIPPVTLV
jgi:ribosomal protein S16